MSSDFFSSPLAEHGAPCPQCSAAMSGDQRYCLSCGARRGEARLDPLEAASAPLASAPAVALAGAAAIGVGTQVATQPAGWEGFPLGDLDFGSPRIVGGAVLGLLAVGVVLGVIGGPNAASTSAAAGQPALVASATAPATDPALGGDTLGGTVDSSSSSSALPVDTGSSSFESVPATPPASGGGGGGGGGGGTTTPTVTSAAPIKHAWVITLSGPSYEEVYGQAAAARAPKVKAKAAASSYLGTELRAKGTLLTNYKSVSAAGLPNSVALVSGQAPNAATKTNCPKFVDVKPGKVDSKTGLVSGDGCRYPPTMKTFPDQMTGAGLVWKGYFESIGNDPNSGVTSCRHPEAGADDPFAAPRPSDGYMTWRNPFVYFRSITESPDCGGSVIGLDRLAPDLAKLEDTPAYSLIAPDACHDGSATSCGGDAVGGIAAADEWLKKVVPSIIESEAYGDGGMIVITSDHAASKPTEEQANVGALVLSPYAAAGSTVTTAYNHYSLLKTLEIAFGVDPIGKAASSSVKAFNKKVFANAPVAGND